MGNARTRGNDPKDRGDECRQSGPDCEACLNCHALLPLCVALEDGRDLTLPTLAISCESVNSCDMREAARKAQRCLLAWDRTDAANSFVSLA